jgi:hypothetical protein
MGEAALADVAEPNGNENENEKPCRFIIVTTFTFIADKIAHFSTPVVGYHTENSVETLDIDNVFSDSAALESSLTIHRDFRW